MISGLSSGHFRKCAQTKGILKSEGSQFLQEALKDGLKSIGTVFEPKAFVQSTQLLACPPTDSF